MDQKSELVKSHLLRERDREVRRVLGLSKKQIVESFVEDLYSLPGSGGSDERRLAREWLERRVDLFLDHNHWEKRHDAFFGFYVPTIQQTEELLKTIKIRSSDRSR